MWIPNCNRYWDDCPSVVDVLPPIDPKDVVTPPQNDPPPSPPVDEVHQSPPERSG